MTGPLPPAWLVPATTWEEATDTTGRLIDETIPRDRVFDEATFRRWRLSIGIAARITQDPETAFTTRSLARAFFDSDAPTDDEDPRDGAD
jgi:hypothetical protein